MFFKVKHSVLQNFILWLLFSCGALKPLFFYFNIPVDITLLAVIVAFGDILFTIFSGTRITVNRAQLFILFVLFTLYALICLSLLYTPSTSFSFVKTALFSINVLYFAYPLFLKNLNMKVLTNLYLFVFLPLAIWFFLARVIYFSPWDSAHRIIRPEFYEIRGYYLGLGKGVAILTLLLVHQRKSWIFIAIAILTIMGLGTRGALIFLILVLVFWKFKEIAFAFRRIKIKSARMLIASSTILLLCTLYYKKIYGFLAVGLERFLVLFSGSSSLGRIERIEFTIKSIFESPQSLLFGHGVGSFGVLYTGNDLREFPHNIFLEAWFELGIIGLVLIGIFLIAPLSLKRPAIFKVIAIFLLLNSLKSGDLAGAWLLFLSYGIVLFNPKIRF